MSNSTSDPKQLFQIKSVSIREFALALKTARETHRQIVPIVGAGLSADSGFPVITAIVRYFGKLYRYIEQKGPLRRGDVPTIAYLEKLFEEYQEKPWRFVEDFGWPDRFQLNQDLYASLREQEEDQEQTSDRSVEKGVRDGLDSVLPLVNQLGWTAYEKLRDEITAKLDYAKKGSGGADDEVIAALEDARDRLYKNWSRSSAFDIVGDWRRLILSFTNYRSDYADALFARFGSARQPGQGHRFLAFLIRFLAVPTVFTFNFDSLIEQTLESDGDRPRVFAMERGAALPHARLVRDHLSVIKMHGSTHALLLDEQLDRPLSADYLQRFAQITGSNPLLLVVGCSEGDQRLRDLVSDVVLNRSSANTPCVLWLHYEDDSPSFLDKLLSKDGAATQKKILTCPTNNPGATLQHLYSWLTGCHPAGSLPYIAHVQQPVYSGKKISEHNTADEWPKKKRFELISSMSRLNPVPSASHELLKRANYWTRYGYYFIWIDLEAVHTFAGVVGAIIDQCRKYDPDLAPSVLPVDIDGLGDEPRDRAFRDATIDLAVNRVARALRRTRYYLALDGLETYVWPASTHHGLSHMAMENANARLSNLGEFLERLVGPKEELGESLVGISVDRPISRHETKLSDHLKLEEVVNKLENVSAHRNSFPKDAVEFVYDEHFEYLAPDLPLVSPKRVGVFAGVDDDQRARRALILFNLSCFRRMRPLVSVRHLIEPLLDERDKRGDDDKDKRDDDTVETTLQQFVTEWKGQVLQQLEGGGYWFTRTIRNKVYAENTTFTDTGDIGKCLTGRTHEGETISTEERVRLCRNSAFQLCLAAMTHQRIARTWYTRTFVQSQDTFSFLEYTYHRISSVRSLVKLRRLVQVASEEPIIAEAVLGGIDAWIGLNNRVDPYGSSKQPEFENDDFIRELRDLFSSPPLSDAKKLAKIEDALKIRHGDELGSLYRAWTRSEVALRTQIPAEQLLHWCRELLTDDLKHRCNRAVIGYRKEPKGYNLFHYKVEYHKLARKDGRSDELIDSNIEDGVIKEFREYLQDLQAKLWIERSDYETCIGARWRHLLDAADDETRDRMIKKHKVSKEDPVDQEKWEALELDVEFIKSCDEAQCHRLLDIVNCRLQWKLELAFHDHEILEARKAPRELLKRVEEQLKRLEERLKAREASKKRTSKPGEVNNLNEAWLRLIHLQVENQMGRITVFTHDGFAADPTKWWPDSLELVKVRETIAAGLQRIKTHDSRTHQAPRSVLLDPTTDGALYLQYRSVFYLLKGRTEWLSSPEGFDKAQWCFEMARGGLGNNSPLMMALIELYAVEALLGRARKELRDVATNEDATEACELAKGLYDSARGGLQRARESLLASRRNVIWRKFFFRLTTQYHSDRLLLGYALLKPKVEKLNAPPKSEEDKTPVMSDEEKAKLRQECEELLRHFLLRLRRAYHSLLTAVDLYLPQSFDQQNEEPCPNRFRWLYRMWWELTLCGYATGRLALSLDKNTDPIAADEFVTAQLEWLNETGGIKNSELGNLINNSYHLLKTKYEEMEENSGNDQGPRQALEERLTLVRLAMETADRPQHVPQPS
jgi:NAD-dependent SIR2 family protein deacetylase